MKAALMMQAQLFMAVNGNLGAQEAEAQARVCRRLWALTDAEMPGRNRNRNRRRDARQSSGVNVNHVNRLAHLGNY